MTARTRAAVQPLSAAAQFPGGVSLGGYQGGPQAPRGDRMRPGSGPGAAPRRAGSSRARYPAAGNGGSRFRCRGSAAGVGTMMRMLLAVIIALGASLLPARRRGAGRDARFPLLAGRRAGLCGLVERADRGVRGQAPRRQDQALFASVRELREPAHGALCRQQPARHRPPADAQLRQLREPGLARSRSTPSSRPPTSPATGRSCKAR